MSLCRCRKNNRKQRQESARKEALFEGSGALLAGILLGQGAQLSREILPKGISYFRLTVLDLSVIIRAL